jgi:hypothetical protein
MYWFIVPVLSVQVERTKKWKERCEPQQLLTAAAKMIDKRLMTSHALLFGSVPGDTGSNNGRWHVDLAIIHNQMVNNQESSFHSKPTTLP